jgi:hypothetical protein
VRRAAALPTTEQFTQICAASRSDKSEAEAVLDSQVARG